MGLMGREGGYWFSKLHPKKVPKTEYLKTTDISYHSSGGQKSEINAVSTGPSPSEICSRESFLARKLLLFAGNTWHALCVCVLVIQSCPTLCDPIDYI